MGYNSDSKLDMRRNFDRPNFSPVAIDINHLNMDEAEPIDLLMAEVYGLPVVNKTINSRNGHLVKMGKKAAMEINQPNQRKSTIVWLKNRIKAGN